MTTTDPAATNGRTLESIRERWQKASAGPWHWSGNTKTRQVYLSRWVKGMGRVTVMAFSRWGMQDAQPQFIDNPADPFVVKPAAEMPVYEVAPDATSSNDRRVYRHDLAGIRHPDAEAIANAPADIAWLLAEVERLQTAQDAALTGALEDIRERRRNFRRLNADPQYLAAMDDAFGLVNNRVRALAPSAPVAEFAGSKA